MSVLLPALPSICLLISCKLWVLCTRSRSTLTKEQNVWEIQDVCFSWPSNAQYQHEKKPTSYLKLLLHEILPLVGSLAFFSFWYGGGGQKLKTTLCKTPGLIRGREVRPILRLKLNNFLSSSSRQQYREGPVGDHECYMSDEVEV